MNYEEKIEKYREFLRDEKEKAMGKAITYYDGETDKTEHDTFSGEYSAFSYALKKLEEIFGASERSGVGENEEVQDVSDKLTCKNCGGKFPDSLTMQGHWCTH